MVAHSQQDYQSKISFQQLSILTIAKNKEFYIQKSSLIVTQVDIIVHLCNVTSLSHLLIEYFGAQYKLVGQNMSVPTMGQL